MKFCIGNNKFQPNKDSIVLTSYNWDDFGYKTLFEVKYIDNKGKSSILGNLSIAAIKEAVEADQNRESLNEWVNYRTVDFLPNNVSNYSDNFISLGDLDYYKNIASIFKDHERIKILNSLNDIAFNTRLYDKYKNIDIVKTSFMRGVNEYTLLNQYHRIATGGKVQIPYNFDLVYTLNNEIKTHISFKVEPNSELPTNVHAIIGNNGTGKTTLIKDLVRTYLQRKPLDSTFIADSKANFSLNDDYGNGTFESILFISFSPFDVLKPSFFNNNDKFNGKFNYIGNSDFVNDKQLIKSPDSISEDLLDNLNEIKKDPKKLERWLDEINKLSFDYEISKFTNGINTESSEDHGLLKKIGNLSSGQKMILLGVSALIAKVNEKTLVIIDEPESFLHPPLVSAYIRILSSILYLRNGVGLIATHSPIIVQEIPNECVWLIKKNNNNIEIRHPETETFGENIGVLMDEIFGLDIRNAGFYKYLQKISESDIEKAKRLLNSNILGNEAQIYLKILLSKEY